MPPRHRKSRTSRMNAAIDAMAPFGFTEEVVIDKMHDLLKEYGGKDGYGFIELDAYRVLLEGLLADQDKRLGKRNQKQVAPRETSMANEMIEAKKVEESHAFGFSDIPACSSLPPPPPPPSSPVLLSPEIAQPHRRRPCHGWIGGDDEKWYFITLPSSWKQPISPPETPPPQPEQHDLSGGRKKRLTRRSRWDLMPEDT